MARLRQPAARGTPGIGGMARQGRVQGQAAQHQFPRHLRAGQIAKRCPKRPQSNASSTPCGHGARQMPAPVCRVQSGVALGLLAFALAGHKVGAKALRLGIGEHSAARTLTPAGAAHAQYLVIQLLCIPLRQQPVTVVRRADRAHQPGQAQHRAGQGVARAQNRLIHNRIAGDLPVFGREVGAKPRGHRRHPRGMLQGDMQDVMPRHPDLLMQRQRLEPSAIQDFGATRLGQFDLGAVAVPAP
ncbi:MAG: hypothetical protein EA386_13940 [Rhodobacteraceae bacterium]|nr:MAG: hypothetical protein EA386_13940 [Paracoccaceae bacterium]